jgi:hypothetical protein
MENCDHIARPIIRRRKACAEASNCGVSANNFVAAPARGNRKGAGAPKGNRNAETHGLRNAAARAQHVVVRDVHRRISEIMTLAGAMYYARTPAHEQAVLLRALLAEARLSLRKLPDWRIAKELTKDQNFQDQSAESAGHRERRDKKDRCFEAAQEGPK